METDAQAGRAVNEHALRSILEYRERGAVIKLRRTISGGRVKVKNGMFGLLDKRFDLDNATYRAVKKALGL